MARFFGAVSQPLYLLNAPVQRAVAMLVAPFAGGNAIGFILVWLPLAVLEPVVAA